MVGTSWPSSDPKMASWVHSVSGSVHVRQAWGAESKETHGMTMELTNQPQRLWDFLDRFIALITMVFGTSKYLGKLYYFTNLGYGHKRGSFTLRTIIYGEVVMRSWSNLPRKNRSASHPTPCSHCSLHGDRHDFVWAMRWLRATNMFAVKQSFL